MKREYSIYDLLLFIFGCTVCLVIILTVGGVIIFKLPTTAENTKVREAIIGILSIIAGSVLTILGQKLGAMIKNDKP